jgi:hypothetical protein
MPGPGFDVDAEALRWWDRWLKGIDNGIDREPTFRYYTKQDFHWHSAGDFPVPGTAFTAYHAGPAGTLSTSASDPSGSDSYVYDPAQGRANGQQGFLPPGQVKPNRPENDNIVSYNEPLGPGDQRLDSFDALNYLTEPLTTDTEVTGPVTMDLVASTTAEDTDFVINVIDVFPDGAPSATGPQPGYWNLAVHGQLKGTHRNGYVRSEPIPPGEQITYHIELQPTSYLFRAGHRIGAQIESADASRSLPNPNPAVVTVFHSSTLTLPVVPR